MAHKEQGDSLACVRRLYPELSSEDLQTLQFNFDSYISTANDIVAAVAKNPARMASLAQAVASARMQAGSFTEFPVPLRTKTRRRRGFSTQDGPVPLEELVEQRESRDCEALARIICTPWLVSAFANQEEQRSLLRILLTDCIVAGKKISCQLRPPFDRMCGNTAADCSPSAVSTVTSHSDAGRPQVPEAAQPGSVARC
jgi:hypothetical protein